MSTLAMNKNLDIARERQLDWLLSEVVGEHEAQAVQATHPATQRPSRSRSWLAAAVAALAVVTAIAVALVHEPTQHQAVTPTQDPVEAIPWHECHGVDEIDSIPVDVRNLKCFRFDDASIGKLSNLTQLERLDLSGNDPNSRGITTSLRLTDEGVARIANLTSLRWLSLSGCSQVVGKTLVQLQAVPQLEHLDLSSTKVTSEAIATLPKLPSLRELSLSFCSDFHGRSMADIARIPGLRRLELSYSYTISASDAMHLAKLHDLRHLDLSICVGQFLGQTAVMFDDVTNGEAPEPPKTDGIGITDAVIEALSNLPLESLNLSHCSSLTNNIGPSIAKMRKLHTLHIRDLPKTDASLLAELPTTLRTLSIDGNRHYGRAELRKLRRFEHLTALGLNGLPELDDELLATVIQDKQLRELRIGGAPDNRRMGLAPPILPKLTARCTTAIGSQAALERLDLSFCTWFDEETAATLGKLPRLQELELKSSKITPDECELLANSSTLRSISLMQCRELPIDCIEALQGCKLRNLNLFGTGLSLDAVAPLAQQWSGCVIYMPNGHMHRVP